MQQHVLMYHHVAPLSGREGLVPYLVTPETFRIQLDAIVRSGLRVRTMQQLVNADQAVTASGRCVVLTFDDCSRELWDFAIPELEKRGLKASFYAVSSRTGGHNDWDDHRGATRIELMGAEELRTLAAMGHEVGSHGISHQRLDQMSDNDVLRELVESRQAIEAMTSVSVQTLAYPFGAVPRRHTALCREAGYQYACSIFSHGRTVLEDPYAVRRILIHEADVGRRLGFKLSRFYLWLRGLRDRRIIAKSAPHHRMPTRVSNIHD